MRFKVRVFDVVILICGGSSNKNPISVSLVHGNQIIAKTQSPNEGWIELDSKVTELPHVIS
jgi:hypothetical protein